MLTRLTVSNYAIIDHLEVRFSENTNVITGETGAGKSIIIGALSLILGQRADAKALKDADKKCVVEATFDISKNKLKAFFKENDLDYDAQTTVRREITSNGKTRSFINDTPVSLTVLKQLGEQLVNLHSQHDTLALNSAQFQLEMVDALVQHDKELAAFGEKYSVYKKIQNEIRALIEQNQHINDKDYLQFQYNELAEVNLKEGEQEQLENELKTLENAEEISGTLGKVSGLLQDSDYAVLNQLREVYTQLKSVSAFHPGISEVLKRVDSTQIELKDIYAELENISGSVVFDPARINTLNERLNTLNRLEQKHRVQNTAELIAVRDALEQKLQSFENLDKELAEKRNALEKIQQEMTVLGNTLHENRTKKKTFIESKVTTLLKDVGMPNARFEIEVEKMPFEKVTEFGLDKVSFLFSANKGGRLEELRSVASGGELSRLMLVLKSLLAASVAMPTLIFDEIDTGVSGETAIKVGALLEKLGKSRQVITITHLPQIARAGDSHFFVYKEDVDDKTVSRMKKLTEKERVIEIAKMIGGEKYSDKALASAKELLLN